MSQPHDVRQVLEHVVARLTARYGPYGIGGAAIRHVVETEASRFAGASVLDYVPIFVERHAVARLEAMARQAQAS